MTALRSVNLAIRFVLELCALAALIAWGLDAGHGVLAKVVLGAGMPALVAAAWGTFRVPGDPGDAPVAVPGPLRLVLELAVWASATAALAAIDRPDLAAVFALTVLANNVLLYDRLVWVWGSR